MNTERTLPHNLQAERAVLGALLVNNGAFDQVAGLLRPDDFYRDSHRRIYAALERALDWTGGKADLVTLQDALTRTGELDECGGPVYVSALVDGVPKSSNAVEYARIVKEKSQLRAAIYAFNSTIAKAYDGETSAADIFTAADKALVDLQANGGAGRMVTLGQTNAALLENIEWRHGHAGEVTGIPTGFAAVDEITLGWQPGELVVIGARPSIGKTTLVMNTATSAATVGKRTAVFSLEMRRQQLEYRMLASLSGVPLTRCLSGRFMQPDWGPLGMAAGLMRDLPIWINDAAGLSIWDIRSDCRRLRSEGGLDLVIIDYVQLIAGSLDRKGASRNDEISDISRRCKTLADELHVPVLLLSQLSRAGDKRKDPRPQLSDLRESGALEQDADNVVLLHRKNHREGGLTNFILAKQRNGPTGTIDLNLDRAIVTFTQWTGPPEAEDVELPSKKGRRAQAPKVATVG